MAESPGLFRILCTTCQARLRVQDPGAVGQIVECPRCGSMVLIEPPPGWSSSQEHQCVSDAASAVPPDPATRSDLSVPEEVAPSLPSATESSLAQMAEAGLDLTRTEEVPSPAEEEPDRSEPSSLGEGTQAPASPKPSWWQAISWKWWALCGAVVLAAGVFWGWSGQSVPRPQNPPPDQTAPPSPSASVAPLVASESPAPPPSPWHELAPWIPAQTQWLVFADWNSPDSLARQALLHRWQEQLDRPLNRFLQASGLEVRHVRWMCWCSAEAEFSSAQAVLVLKLRPEVPSAVLARLGLEPSVPEASQGHPSQPNRPVWKRFKQWPWPVVAVGPRLLLTGAEKLLRSLLAGSASGPDRSRLGRLLQLVMEDSAAVALAAGHACLEKLIQALPPAWLHLWAAQEHWTRLGQRTQALAAAWNPQEGRCTLALQGATESITLELQDHLAAVVQSVAQLLRQELQQLPQWVQQGRLSAPEAQRVQPWLEQTLQALQSAQFEFQEPILLVRWASPPELEAWLTGLVQNLPAWDERVQNQALALGARRMGRLGQSLQAHGKAQGFWPQGAAGSTLLPPQRRLSWIASLLPYLGRLEWYRQLSAAHSWNDPVNRAIVQRTLPEVLNPTLRATRSSKGFGLTHFVAVGGWGEQSPWLEASHPDAGLFGFNRRWGLQRLPGGASHTVAVLSVQQQLGPWASGGQATVRGVSVPLVGGPGGFGAPGAPGPLALMADGSVRVLSAQMDPQVLRYLVVVRKSPQPPSPFELGKQLWPRSSPPSQTVAQAPQSPSPPQPSSKSKPPQQPKPPAGSAKSPAVASAPPAELPPGLQLPVEELQLREVPLEEVAHLLAQMAGLELVVEVEALLEAGVPPQTKVTVVLRRASLRQALQLLEAEWGLQFRWEKGKLILSAPTDPPRLIRRRYPVAWLLDQQLPTPEQVARLLRRLIAPGTWAPEGSPGQMLVEADAVVVVHTPAAHRELQHLLNRWELYRRRPVETRGPTTRWQQALLALRQQVRLNYRVPVPLRHVLSALQQQTGVLILLDGRRLRAQGLSPEEPVTIQAQGVSLWDALNQVVEPLKLTVVVEDAQTIKITTAEAAAEQIRVEIYPLGRWWPESQQHQQIRQLLPQQIRPASWHPQGRGFAHWDSRAGVWIVAQSPPVHLELEQWFAQRLEQKQRNSLPPAPAAPTPPESAQKD